MIGTGIDYLDTLLSGGYPLPGSVLVIGPPSIEKEILGLQFVLSGLRRGDVGLVLVTTRTRHDIEATFRLLNKEKTLPGEMFFIDASGLASGSEVDIVRLDDVYSAIEDFLSSRRGRIVRAYIELLSPALMVNPSQKIYEFAFKLHKLLHQHQATAVLPLEGSMHDERSVASLKQVTDGVIDLELVREGLDVNNYLSIEKMGSAILSSKPYNFSLVMPESEKLLHA